MGDYEVILRGGSPWGIRLQGGAGCNTPLKIAQVTAGSKAEANGVLADSLVMEINGNKTEYLAMLQAQTLIKKTGSELILLLRHPDKVLPVCTRYVIMDGGKPWGLRLQGGRDYGLPLMIAQVTSGSKSEKQGVHVGDELVSINDYECNLLTLVQAQNLIKETGQQLKLGIKFNEDVTSRSYKEDSDETNSEEKKAPFMDELKETMGTRDVNWGRQHVAKGNTFISLQEHTDAGLAQNVRTVFDVPTSDRNKSIPILAPRIKKGSESVDDTDLTGEERGWEITMVGGKPWGIRLQGGKIAGIPLQIAQVTPGSKAALAGLQDGDQLVSINDVSSNELSMIDAQNLIKETGDKLKLRIGTIRPEKRTSKEIDEEFYEDLRISMQGCSVDKRDIKSHAFKKLQSIVDSGEMIK